MGIRDIYCKIKPELVGRDKFELFCKEMGLMTRKSRFRPRTTDSNGVIRFPNLLIGLKIIRLDQVWQSDITYYELNNRFYYLTFILDAFSRRILGHSVSKSLSTDSTTLPALHMAIKTRRQRILPGLILHSDGGGQYYAKEFLKLTQFYKIQNSMCEYPWDNGKAERINGVIKNNYLKHWSIKTYEGLVKGVDRSVQLYNSEKPHVELKRIAPIAFEKNIASLRPQNKPKMTESFDAKLRT